ncbi:MAG: glycosyl transferase [Catenulispora sp. 13_1_20CM_3_70_7]|nr:MAG: glycosyl transferase [Catenulispora sp. 13_1_20CM_3_70_7]
MRIALVSEHANPLAALGGADAGGQNVHVACLALQIAKLGHSVIVYTRRDNTDSPARSPMGPVVVEQVPAGPPARIPKDDLFPFMPEFAERLADRWDVFRPDIVHAHFWMSGMASVRAATLTGTPVVQTYHALGTVKKRHQGADDTSPACRISVERDIGWACDQIIATCRDEVLELSRMGIDSEQVSIVPCGVDLDRFGPAGPRADRGGARHRLLAIGRLVPRKGFDTAIEALAGLPDTELVIAGGPAPRELAADPQARRLRELAEARGLADRVHLTGGVPRELMPALIRSADVVVCTPWYEPFGIVPLEAMASGKPVVASAVGGLTDTVLDGVTGALVPPKNAPALVAALVPLLGDPALRRRAGRSGLFRARTRYGWPQIAQETVDIYARVVARRNVLTKAVNR